MEILSILKRNAANGETENLPKERALIVLAKYFESTY
jgi:hypothetical protein